MMKLIVDRIEDAAEFSVFVPVVSDEEEEAEVEDDEDDEEVDEVEVV
jgi:hypothetical protein